MSDTPAFTLNGPGNRPRTAIAEPIESQIARLRANPGCRVVGIVEIERYREIRDDDAEVDPTVVLRMSALELAKGADQEAQLRLAMQALHLHRTAGGTLTEDGDVELAQKTLDNLGDKVSVYESARLRAAVEYVEVQLRGLAANNKHNDGDLRRELKKLTARVTAALAGEQLTIDGTSTMPAKKAPVPVVDLDAAIAAIPDDRDPGSTA